MANNNKITRIVTQDNFVTEKIDVIENNLLGVYEDDGDYKISPQIVNELLKLRKTKRANFANSVFCVGSLLGYGELVFELTFASKTHNGKSASATLYLLENVDKINGYLQNTIKTKLEVFNEVVENFIEATYQHFNIHSKDEDEDDAEVLERKLDEDLDNEDSFIIAKKQYSLMLEKLLEEKYLDAYGKYFTSRMSILTKEDNEFTNAVLDSFNKQYSLIQNVFLKEKNYKILNELLDKCLEEFSGINPAFTPFEKRFADLVHPSLDIFVDSVNKLNERFENKALHMLGKEDRKKVEEILEEHAEMELNDSENESEETKQSAENIVNAIPQNTYTLKDQIGQEKEQQTEEKEETHFIEEILRKGQKEQETQEQNFYDAFKEQYGKSEEKTTNSNKVVDMSRSENIEESNKDEEIAVSSLKDRISRLEKFKESSAIENESKTTKTMVLGGSSGSEREQKEKDDKVSTIFDTLAREKERKVEQFDIRNRRNRAEIDGMSMDQNDMILANQREQIIKTPERTFDFFDMEK